MIVMPYGDQHVIGGESPAECVSIMTLLDPPPWATMPLVRYGGGGPRTDLVCGYLVLRGPAVRSRSCGRSRRCSSCASPPGAAASWVQASIALRARGDACRRTRVRTRSSTRLPELVLIEVLRLHLASAPGGRSRLDRRARAIRCSHPRSRSLHGSPERQWTVAELASDVAVSRSLLDERFRQVLGRSPIRYLTEWRMHLADELLATTELGVATVARRVGYDSEESFSRAFKRARGLSPSHWRAARSTNSAASKPRPDSRGAQGRMSGIEASYSPRSQWTEVFGDSARTRLSAARFSGKMLATKVSKPRVTARFDSRRVRRLPMPRCCQVSSTVTAISAFRAPHSAS